MYVDYDIVGGSGYWWIGALCGVFAVYVLYRLWKSRYDE